MTRHPDIDIDTPSNFVPEKIFPSWTRASMLQDGKLRHHPCGMHPQSIAQDPLTHFAAIPYDIATKEYDYFKIDFLHLHVYDHFSSKEEIDELLKIDPDWNLLQSPSTVKQLFQIGKHYDILTKIKPRSIMELSDVISLIRPGKFYLIQKYIENKQLARKYLYEKNEDEAFTFKKSHAVAYAMVIVLQLHLISLGVKFN
jgi:hypothetical protein